MSDLRENAGEILRLFDLCDQKTRVEFMNALLTYGARYITSDSIYDEVMSVENRLNESRNTETA